MFCPKCGAENDAQASFCRQCGNNLEAAKVQQPAPAVTPGLCQKCGTQNDAQARFCRQCGNSLGTASGTQAAPVSAAQTAAVYPAQAYAVMSDAVRYAGFWKRFIAYLIDVIILIIPLLLASIIPFAGIIVMWLYFAVLESSESQATFGKRAMGIIVTDTDGRRISFGKATIRHFSKIISAIILLIGYLMIGFTKRKQGLHDMIAGTLVIVKK